MEKRNALMVTTFAAFEIQAAILTTDICVSARERESVRVCVCVRVLMCICSVVIAVALALMCL